MSSDFFSGFIAAGYFVATLFFLKFWRRTGQGLFLWFALAFAVLGSQPAIVGALSLGNDQESELFLLRLAGFLLIIVGVIVANVSSSKR